MDLREEFAFERSLKPGDEVLARWTSSGGGYRGRSRVVKINEKSFRVELLEQVSGYPLGHLLTIPKFMGTGWGQSNRVGSLTTITTKPVPVSPPPRPVPQPISVRPLPRPAASGPPATREELFELFKEAARVVWPSGADFALEATVLSYEQPKDDVFASLTWVGGKTRVIGDVLFQRPKQYILRISDRLLVESPTVRKRIMIHEAVHLGYGNHGKDFREMVRRHGGAVSEHTSGEDLVEVIRKEGARFKGTGKFFKTEGDAEAWIRDEAKRVPGKYGWRS